MPELYPSHRYPNLTDLQRRKMVREAARSLLPNATETKMVFTANARALRHFIEYRGSEHADAEMRAVALRVLEIMSHECPAIFGDYSLMPGDTCTFAETQFVKV
jgi:thymidylate synthase (FAD)